MGALIESSDHPAGSAAGGDRVWPAMRIVILAGWRQAYNDLLFKDGDIL